MTPPALPFLAALSDLPKGTRTFKVPTIWLSDVLLIVGLGLGLLLLLAGTIYFWMKARRHRRRHITGGEKVYRDHDGDSADAESASQPEFDSDLDEDEEDDDEGHEDEDDSGDGEHHHHHHHHHHGRRRYKYRKRRRSHRSRNPTLSETGGLPPVKTQAPSKPF